MNLFLILLTIIGNIIPIQSGDKCIPAQRILETTKQWKIVNTKIETTKKFKILIIQLHNQLDTDRIVSAQLTLALNQLDLNPERDLVEAFFYNKNAIIVFKRIFAIYPDKDKKRADVSIMTPCFNREIKRIETTN